MTCACDVKKQLDGMITQVGAGPEMAIPLLQAVQNEFRYVPIEAIEYIAANTEMTETQLYGVVTFFSQFRLEAVGEQIIKVCHGTACHVAGAEGVTEALESALDIEDGGTTSDGKYTLESVACLGCCSLAPVVAVDEKVHAHIDRAGAVNLISEAEGVSHE